jgi:hypothetical protein
MILGLNASNIHAFQRAMPAQVSPYGQTYTPMYYEYWAGDSPWTPAMLSTKVISSKAQWLLLAFHAAEYSPTSFFMTLSSTLPHPVSTTHTVTRQFGLLMM